MFEGDDSNCDRYWADVEVVVTGGPGGGSLNDILIEHESRGIVDDGDKQRYSSSGRADGRG